MAALGPEPGGADRQTLPGVRRQLPGHRQPPREEDRHHRDRPQAPHPRLPSARRTSHRDTGHDHATHQYGSLTGMLRSLVPGVFRRVPSTGWFTQPSLFWTWLVTVNSSSLSGRRIPFFSTTFPIEIRPVTESSTVADRPLAEPRQLRIYEQERRQKQRSHCSHC